MNAERNAEILKDHFLTGKKSVNELELPPLLVTNIHSDKDMKRVPSSLVKRDRSKVHCIIENHMQKRKETRAYFHRNCLPSDGDKVNSRVLRKEYVRPPKVVPEVQTLVDTLDTPTDTIPQIQERNDELCAVPPQQQLESQQIADDIKELEKLIEETHQFLKAEGVVDSAPIFHKREYASDKEILEELERDLDELVALGPKDNFLQQAKTLEELENEIGALIK